MFGIFAVVEIALVAALTIGAQAAEIISAMASAAFQAPVAEAQWEAGRVSKSLRAFPRRGDVAALAFGVKSCASVIWVGCSVVVVLMATNTTWVEAAEMALAGSIVAGATGDTGVCAK